MRINLRLMAVIFSGLVIALNGLAERAHSFGGADQAKKWKEIEDARFGVDDQILSYVGTQRSMGSEVLVRGHWRVVDGLVKIADKTERTDSESRIRAMLALGKMSKESGLLVLVRHIEFAPPITVDESSPLQANPAALALWDAGFASIPHIFGYLLQQPPENVSDRAIELYAYIVFGQCNRVIGGRTAATHLVETRIENSSELYNKNLKRLRDKLRVMETQPATIGN